MRAYTPGPWIAAPSVVPSASYVRVETAQGLTVALATSTPDRSINSANANARLIAAAPALLEALERVLYCGVTPYAAWDEAVEAARAAIALAKEGV